MPKKNKNGVPKWYFQGVEAIPASISPGIGSDGAKCWFCDKPAVITLVAHKTGEMNHYCQFHLVPEINRMNGVLDWETMLKVVTDGCGNVAIVFPDNKIAVGPVQTSSEDGMPCDRLYIREQLTDWLTTYLAEDL